MSNPQEQELIEVDVHQMMAFLETLEVSEIDETMEATVVNNILRLSAELQQEQFQPLFKKYIELVESKEILHNPVYKNILNSAFAALASYEYNADEQVGPLTLKILDYFYNLKYDLSMQQDAEIFEQIQTRETPMRKIMILRSMPESLEQLKYVLKTYPRTSDFLEATVVEIENATDLEILQETYTLQLLAAYPALTKEQMHARIEVAYQNITGQKLKNQSEVMSLAGYMEAQKPYVRETAKINRNDACPCGSGKKYKFCCGSK